MSAARLASAGERELRYQVRDLLLSRADVWADLLDAPDLRPQLHQMVDHALPYIIGRLTGDDEEMATRTLMDLLVLEHGDSATIPAEWWTTPLGRVAARVGEHDDAEAVTPSVAARMLGVAAPTVYQWRREGKLERHPDGGVTKASVMARLAEMSR